jgi:putative transposase
MNPESYDKSKMHSRSMRLKDYNYSQEGAYFITICAYNRQHIFGDIINEQMNLNRYGETAFSCWQQIPEHFGNVDLDVFAILPNHIHGIVSISEARHAMPLIDDKLRAFGERVPGSISTIIASYKSATTKVIHSLPDSSHRQIWQRGFYDHVIRDDNDLDQIREYIEANHLLWSQDHENPENTGLSDIEKTLFMLKENQ